MDTPTYSLWNFKSLAISQRLFCSSVAMALLKENYRAGMPNWMKLEKALARSVDLTGKESRSESVGTMKASPGSAVPSSYTFREGWELKHRLQSETLDALKQLAGLPPHSRNLGRIELVQERNLESGDYYGRLMLAFFALECGGPDVGGRSKQAASAVIASSRLAWDPEHSGKILVPAHLQPGMTDLASKVKESLGSEETIGSKIIVAGQENTTLRVTQAVRAKFGEAEPRFWPKYLAAIPPSTGYAMQPVLARWAIDLVSAAAASQALLLRELHHPSFGAHYRKLARFNCAVASFFLNKEPRTRFSDIFRLVWTPAAISHWERVGPTWTLARLVFQTQLRDLGVCANALGYIWDSAHSHLDTATRTKIGMEPTTSRHVLEGDLSNSEVESSLRPETFRADAISDWILSRLTPWARAKAQRHIQSTGSEVREQLSRYLSSQEELLAYRRTEDTPSKYVPVINYRTCVLGPQECRCKSMVNAADNAFPTIQS